MSEISKELCEVCGIKPLYKVMLNGIMLDITDDKKLAEISVFKRGGVIVDTYPDFEQPENFVKLLKIANDVLGSVHFTTAYTRNKSGIFEEQALLHYLPIVKLNEAFKQAIRKEEWIYDCCFN